MDALSLHAEIAKVCPIEGVSVGVADNRATWKFWTKPGVTEAQVDAANEVIATIDVNYKVPEAESFR